MITRPLPIPAEPAPSALERAFARHYVPLLRMCTALTGRRDVAEDLVQDAFVRFLPRADRLSEDEAGPYLRQTVVNLWKNRLRRLTLELRHRTEDRVMTSDPASQVNDRDLLWRGLRALPARQRACVVLRYYEDLSEREVARILGCSVGTVKTQTSRGRERLEKELQHAL